MGKFWDFIEQIGGVDEGLWLNDRLAEPGKSKIYPPKQVKTQTIKLPPPKKFRIPPPMRIERDHDK